MEILSNDYDLIVLNFNNETKQDFAYLFITDVIHDIYDNDFTHSNGNCRGEISDEMIGIIINCFQTIFFPNVEDGFNNNIIANLKEKIKENCEDYAKVNDYYDNQKQKINVRELGFPNEDDPEALNNKNIKDESYRNKNGITVKERKVCAICNLEGKMAYKLGLKKSVVKSKDISSLEINYFDTMYYTRSNNIIFSEIQKNEYKRSYQAENRKLLKEGKKAKEPIFINSPYFIKKFICYFNFRGNKEKPFLLYDSELPTKQISMCRYIYEKDEAKLVSYMGSTIECSERKTIGHIYKIWDQEDRVGSQYATPVNINTKKEEINSIFFSKFMADFVQICIIKIISVKAAKKKPTDTFKLFTNDIIMRIMALKFFKINAFSL